MSCLFSPTAALLELVFPHHCLLCGQLAGLVPFVHQGARDPLLRLWDRPHLCCRCYDGLQGEFQLSIKQSLVCGASTRTSPNLVELVGQWKYHGIRGLGWPLATLLVPTVEAMSRSDLVDVLLPIPLHRTRRRSRGFNQAGMLARLVGNCLGINVASDLLHRVKNTRQQARLQGDSLRKENIQGAFRLSDGSLQRPLRIGLIDDLVTTGATALSAAQALGAGGFDVRWVASLGISYQNMSK